MNTKYKNDTSQFTGPDTQSTGPDQDMVEMFKDLLEKVRKVRGKDKPVFDPKGHNFDPVNKSARELFEAVRAYPPYDNIFLMDSTANGEDTSVIAIAFKSDVSPHSIAVRPVFLVPTPSMELLAPDGQKAVSYQDHVAKMALHGDLVPVGEPFEA